MQHSMAPFFMSLAFYIGCMIGAMLIVVAYKSFSPLIGRWKAYTYTEIAIILISMIAPLLIVALSKSMLRFDSNTYWQLWVNHSIELFASLNVNLIFSLILGQLGIMINIPFMLTQVVSGAGLIPRPILPDFFKVMSNISPCFYSIRADYNILYGGNNTHPLVATSDHWHRSYYYSPSYCCFPKKAHTAGTTFIIKKALSRKALFYV